MNRPQKSVAEIWENAEALIEHFEQTVRSWSRQDPDLADSMTTAMLLDDLVTRLRTTSDALSVTLMATDDQATQTLARTGMTIAGEPPNSDQTRLLASTEFLPDASLDLELHFAAPLMPAVRQPLSELCEALLEIAVGVVLRDRLKKLRRDQNVRAEHDQWIESLYRGSSLRDCFRSIATSIATRCGVDRVSLFRIDRGRAELIACSNQPSIDRRASQVRLLEELVVMANDGDDCSEATQKHRERSGSQQVEMETVAQADTVVVLERFGAAPQPDDLKLALDPIRDPVQTAIVAAVERDQFDWAEISGEAAKVFRHWRLAYIGPLVLASLAIATFVRVPLNLPVNGRVVAAHSQKIFAPAEGIVDQVLVGDGEIVSTGTPLLRLRSPKLELQQRTVEGALSTARTRLDALRVSRDNRDRSQTADAEVLKTEIAGLESQLQLIERQRSELSITSPIDGRVERWDLRSTLTARPVAVGQFLLNVVAESDGWQVELNVPDQNIGYLLDQQPYENCLVSFRLRSEATTVHQSAIESIADSAHLDSQGRSVVLATVPVNASDLNIRNGATVLAQVDCGPHPIGFVWFRGLIEWWRSSSWF